jgi:hypothetical protein
MTTTTAGPDGGQAGGTRTYEGHVAFADGTLRSLQCYEGRHGECPDVTPPGWERDRGGPLNGHYCECPGCPGHPTAPAGPAPAVEARYFYGAQLVRYAADGEQPNSDMYVLEALGLRILVRRRAAGSYVHVDTKEAIDRASLPLYVEVNHGGETIHRDAGE